MKGKSADVFRWVLPIGILGLLVAWPLLRVLTLPLSSPHAGTGTTDGIPSAEIISIAVFTVRQAALSTALTLLLAIPSAFVLYRHTFLGRRVIHLLITIPFILPSIVVAICFTNLQSIPVLSDLVSGDSALAAIIIAHLFLNYGLVTQTIGNAWNNIPAQIEEASELDGASGLKKFLHITLPQLRLTILSITALVFLYCLTSFGIILTLGGGAIRTIETEIYFSAIHNLDLTTASTLALLQMALCFVVFVVAQRLGSANLFVDESLHSQSAQRLIGWRKLVLVPVGIFIGLIIALPLAILIGESFQVNGQWTLSNYINLTTHGARENLSITVLSAATNTIRNVMIASLLAMVLGTRVAYLLSKSANRGKFLDWLFQLPLGVSSVVLGLGYLITFTDGLFPLRSSWLVTPIVQGLLAIPLVIRITYPSFLNIHDEILAQASLDGATNEQIWWHIQSPTMKPALKTALGFSALISLGEFGAASFLAYGNQSTVPTLLYQLISHPGPQNYGMATATSVIIIGFAALVMFAVGNHNADLINKSQ